MNTTSQSSSLRSCSCHDAPCPWLYVGQRSQHRARQCNTSATLISTLVDICRSSFIRAAALHLYHLNCGNIFTAGACMRIWTRNWILSLACRSSRSEKLALMLWPCLYGSETKTPWSINWMAIILNKASLLQIETWSQSYSTDMRSCKRWLWWWWVIYTTREDFIDILN